MQMNQDETSRALLEAAHRLLADDGPEALTVRRIATEAGMSTMNVYSRFGGKDGVIDELYIDGYTRLFAAINSVPQTDDVRADLVQMSHEYRRFALDNPTYYGVMFRSAVHDFEPSQKATELALAGLETFVRRVELGQERGDIVSDVDNTAVDITAWLWASCHGLVSLELFGIGRERIEWAAVFDRGLRAAVDSLRPTVSSRS